MNRDAIAQTVRTDDGQVVPVAVGLRGDQPVFVLDSERPTPETCNHAGYGWSQDFYLRCGRCGAPMVLPSRMIACKSVDEIREMERAWLAAGAPEFRLLPVETDAGVAIMLVWDLEEGWALTEHPLFDHLGGLPMRAPGALVDAATTQD